MSFVGATYVMSCVGATYIMLCDGSTYIMSYVCATYIMSYVGTYFMYIKPLSTTIDSHSIMHHSFDDDLHLQMSAPPNKISELLHSMQSYE